MLRMWILKSSIVVRCTFGSLSTILLSNGLLKRNNVMNVNYCSITMLYVENQAEYVTTLYLVREYSFLGIYILENLTFILLRKFSTANLLSSNLFVMQFVNLIFVSLT